jgi:hypothetical protein
LARVELAGGVDEDRFAGCDVANDVEPSGSMATDSDAQTHSVPPIASFLPTMSGRMPYGSRNASMP